MKTAGDIRVAVTDGLIAAINLESARTRAWSRLWQDPTRSGVAESIVEMEQFAAQYLGGLEALDRLEDLAGQVARAEGESARSALVCAQTASIAHRFSDARRSLVEARARGASYDSCKRLQLAVDQACSTDIPDVLAERRTAAASSQSLEDLVPLGSLLADLGEFDEAEHTFLRALEQYRDVSPFAIAWVCFQLGVLWGELVPEPETERAADWYEKALAYLPGYVKARVHLAEIEIRNGRYAEAEALLMPVLSSSDPEVSWRLADALISAGKRSDGERYLQLARSTFEALVAKHPLAFADHAAEFYAGSGDDALRASELAALNVANRPTLRALEAAHEAALRAGQIRAASQFAAAAAEQHRWTAAFRHSPFAVLDAIGGPV